jgi:hypothetical protein
MGNKGEITLTDSDIVRVEKDADDEIICIYLKYSEIIGKQNDLLINKAIKLSIFYDCSVKFDCVNDLKFNININKLTEVVNYNAYQEKRRLIEIEKSNKWVSDQMRAFNECMGR